jgi:hypothetical protein
MSVFSVNTGQFSLPGIPFVNGAASSGATDVAVAGADVGASNVILVQGVDLVDSNLNQNDDAWVYYDFGAIGAVRKILRGFVYATSQGTFTWRGSLPLVQGAVLKMATLVGAWECTTWGIVIPVSSITP